MSGDPFAENLASVGDLETHIAQKAPAAMIGGEELGVPVIEMDAQPLERRPCFVLNLDLSSVSRPSKKASRTAAPNVSLLLQ